MPWSKDYERGAGGLETSRGRLAAAVVAVLVLAYLAFAGWTEFSTTRWMLKGGLKKEAEPKNLEPPVVQLPLVERRDGPQGGSP